MFTRDFIVSLAVYGRPGRVPAPRSPWDWIRRRRRAYSRHEGSAPRPGRDTPPSTRPRRCVKSRSCVSFRVFDRAHRDVRSATAFVRVVVRAATTGRFAIVALLCAVFARANVAAGTVCACVLIFIECVCVCAGCGAWLLSTEAQSEVHSVTSVSFDLYEGNARRAL